jgi:hypothetical protein
MTIPFVFLACLLAVPAFAACRVERRATVPITRAGDLLLVPVSINGVVADFVLDTGAERSVVGLAAADRLHLARDEWVSTDIMGTGGRDRRRLGLPASLSLGGITLRRQTLAADNSVVVGPIQEQVGGRPITGLLGEDFLSPFDLDLDIVGGKLTLYSVSGCAGHFLPWTEHYTAIAAWRPVRNILMLPMRVGDTRIQAELDSGASITTVTLPGMIALGLVAGGNGTMRGFGTGSIAARTQHFPNVQIGDMPPAAADLAIAPIRTLRSVGVLLGADWMGKFHVWVSWATDQVFLAAPT